MKKVDVKLVKFVWIRLRPLMMLLFVVTLVVALGVIWTLKKRQAVMDEIKILAPTINISGQNINTAAIFKVNENTSLLTGFLPDRFNVFRTLNLIERIGDQTGFNVDSFILSFQNLDVKDKLQTKQLQIAGSGTPQAFLAFLKEYKYITGQIITIDNVNLIGTNNLITNLSLNIYAYDPNIDLNENVRSNLDSIDDKILEKIRENVDVGDSEAISDDYESKEDPFKEF